MYRDESNSRPCKTDTSKADCKGGKVKRPINKNEIKNSMRPEGVVTWAEIDLNAIEYNIKAYKKHINPLVEVIAVVKANAYGHGAVQVAQAALSCGAGRLAVHRAIEGVELRQAGIEAPILIMGYTPSDGAKLIVENDLTPSLITHEFAQALSGQAQALGRRVPVHIKVDSGMGRYGLQPTEVSQFAESLNGLPGLYLEGLFTHFSTADSLDQSHTLNQLAVFKDVVTTLETTGIHVPLVHAANSAAAMRFPQAQFNAIRLGLAMYGMNPSDEWPPVFEIHPALTLKSCISRVSRLPIGTGISYGRTFITPEDMEVGLVPVGYGDGFHRILSNRGAVLVHGKRASLLGRVCMDQFVIDLRGIPDVQQDDEVVLIGSQGQERITAEEVAGLAETINYEVTTSLLPRVRRVYFRGK